MGAPLLSTSTDAASVRNVINTLLDTDDLPDATILDDIYAGRASDQVRTWLVQWGVQPMPADDDPAMRRAAVLATASYVVQAQPNLLSERLPDSTFTYQAAQQGDGPADRARQLLAQASGQLRQALGLGLGQQRIFGKAVGRRGAGVGPGILYGPGRIGEAAWYAGQEPNPG